METAARARTSKALHARPAVSMNQVERLNPWNGETATASLRFGKMDKINKYGTIVDLLTLIQKDHEKFFEKAMAIAVEPNNRLYGTAWVQFFSTKDTDTAQLPTNAVYIQKLIAMRDGQGGYCSFIVTNKQIQIDVITALTGTLNPRVMPDAKDGHHRWLASTPPSETLVGYLTLNGRTLEIDPAAMFNDKTGIVDMQCVMLRNGNFDIVMLTRDGKVYKAVFTPDMIRTNVLPAFQMIGEGVNTVLTLPYKNNPLIIFGTRNGILLNGNPIPNTAGHDVNTFIYRIDKGLVFYAAGGTLYTLNYDGKNKIFVVGTPYTGDLGTFVWAMSGPAVKTEDNKDGILFTGWNKTSDGRFNVHTSKVLPMPTNLVS